MPPTPRRHTPRANMKCAAIWSQQPPFSPTEAPFFVLQSTLLEIKTSRVTPEALLSETSYRSLWSLKSWCTEILPSVFYTVACWIEQFFPLFQRFKLPALTTRHPSRLSDENYASMAMHPAETLTWNKRDLGSSLCSKAYRDVFLYINYSM